MIKQFVALSGLPRTGSTLLSAILSQNPCIHSEGLSAVCHLMWNMQQTVLTSEEIKTNNKNIINPLVKSIPSIYYADITKPIIVDRCRSWTLPDNIKMLNTYFDNEPKIIVLVRPLVEVVASIMFLRKENGWTNLDANLFDEYSNPIMRALDGVKWAKNNNNGEFLFITYDELVNDTQTSIDRIYKHCDWKPFVHNFNNVVNKHVENDNFYEANLVGLHHIRSTISKRKLNIELSDELINKCKQLDI